MSSATEGKTSTSATSTTKSTTTKSTAALATKSVPVPTHANATTTTIATAVTAVTAATTTVAAAAAAATTVKTAVATTTTATTTTVVSAQPAAAVLLAQSEWDDEEMTTDGSPASNEVDECSAAYADLGIDDEREERKNAKSHKMLERRDGDGDEDDDDNRNAMPYITTDALDSILADHQDLDYDDDDDDGGADDNGKRSSRTSSTLDAKGDDDGAIIDAMEDDAPARDKAVSQNGESSTRGAVFDRFHWGFLTDERNPCGPFSVILSPSASERKALSKMVKDAFELRKYLQRKRGNTNTSEALKLFPDNHYSMPGMLMQELQRLNERRSTSNRNFWLYLPSTVVLSRSIPFPCKLIWYKGDASSLDCVTEALRLRNIYSKTFGWVARLAWEENAISSTRGYNNNDDGKNGDDNNNNNNNNNASSNAKDKKKDDTTAVAIAATENDQCTFTLHLHMPRARFPSSHRVCKASVNYAGFRTAVIGPGDAYDAFIAGFDRATGSSLVWGTGQLSILAGLSKTDKPRAAVIVRRTLAEIVLSLERQFTTVIITGIDKDALANIIESAEEARKENNDAPYSSWTDEALREPVTAEEIEKQEENADNGYSPARWRFYEFLYDLVLHTQHHLKRPDSLKLRLLDPVTHEIVPCFKGDTTKDDKERDKELAAVAVAKASRAHNDDDDGNGDDGDNKGDANESSVKNRKRARSDNDDADIGHNDNNNDGDQRFDRRHDSSRYSGNRNRRHHSFRSDSYHHSYTSSRNSDRDARLVVTLMGSRYKPNTDKRREKGNDDDSERGNGRKRDACEQGGATPSLYPNDDKNRGDDEDGSRSSDVKRIKVSFTNDTNDQGRDKGDNNNNSNSTYPSMQLVRHSSRRTSRNTRDTHRTRTNDLETDSRSREFERGRSRGRSRSYSRSPSRSTSRSLSRERRSTRHGSSYRRSRSKSSYSRSRHHDHGSDDRRTHRSYDGEGKTDGTVSRYCARSRISRRLRHSINHNRDREREREARPRRRSDRDDRSVSRTPNRSRSRSQSPSTSDASRSRSRSASPARTTSSRRSISRPRRSSRYYSHGSNNNNNNSNSNGSDGSRYTSTSGAVVRMPRSRIRSSYRRNSSYLPPSHSSFRRNSSRTYGHNYSGKHVRSPSRSRSTHSEA